MTGFLERLTSSSLLLAILAVLATVVAWELLRFAVVGTIAAWLGHRSRTFVDRHHVRIDPFKFSGRSLVREELLNDVDVQAAIVQAARSGEPIERARARVDEYLDEITPRFSLTAYFSFGYLVARTCLRLLYRVEPHRPSFERLKDVPDGASVMFLMNHRSNVDYLLVAVALARRVAISFAIGEWARVFPLDLLFKLFGGYFLRRNFRDPLYHAVLRRYLQLIVRHGVTQGLFPEGRLTRDGRLNEPKIGLLDAMVAMAAEPGFDRPIVFVPVGLNFDRVLEDDFLIVEAARPGPPTRAEKRSSLRRLVTRAPRQLAVTLARLATGRLHRFGYASCAIGDPLDLESFARTKGLDARALAALPKEQRRPLVKELADELMGRIQRVTPATPVPLTCAALVSSSEEAIDRAEVTRRIAERIRALRADGVPVVEAREFEATARARAELSAAEQQEVRRPELARLEHALLDLEEAEEHARLGLERLVERGLVRVDDERIAMTPEALPLLRYYAASLHDPTVLRQEAETATGNATTIAASVHAAASE